MARETKGFVCLGQKEDEESGLEDKDDDAFSHTSSRSLGHMERLERWFELHIRQEYGPWDAVLILVYMGLTGCRFEAFDHYDTHTAYANKYAIFFTASLLSFVVAIVVAFVLEGDQTMKKLLSWNRFWHFACISVLWAFASLLWSSAYEIGPIPADAVVASCFYLPIATWLSELYFKERSYSMMAWFSVLIQTAAMATFLALRRRYRDCPVGAECGTEVALEYMRSHHSWLSAMITICSVMVSCVGSVLAEKLYLSWKHDSFAVLNAHVQFCGVIFHFIGWLVYANPMVPDAAPTKPLNASAIKDQAMSENLLPDMNWNALEWGLVFLIAAQGWAAGLVVKNFSTVSKSVLSGMATIGFLFVGDELERKYRYDIREKPALLLFLVLVLAGMLFQSSMVHSRDRRRTKKMERRAEIDESVTDESEGYVSPDEDGCCSTPWTQEREQEVVVPASQRLRLNSLNSAPVDDTGSSYLVSITVVYMITYVTVREFNSIAVSRSEINPTSLTMMTFLGGLLYACAMTYKAHGWDGTSRTYNELHYKGQGLKQALNPKKLMEFASASFLFALSQVCQNMAYASPGANPALISVVGTVYVPILAILNRLMGRRILWIEWIAIVILFLSTVVFGWLQSYDPVRGMVLETYQPILLVCLSATAAAFRDLKQNFLYLANRDADFMMNMIRFQLGGFFFTALLLPVLSLTATRPKDIIWIDRPITHDCGRNFTHCFTDKPFFNLPWDMDNITACGQLPGGGCDSPCECEAGVFPAWAGAYAVYIFLFLSIFFGWVTGQIIAHKQGGAMYKAGVDGVALALVYWVGDPLNNWVQWDQPFRSSLKDWVLNLVSVIVPMAALTSEYAKKETKQYLEERVAFRMGLVSSLWALHSNQPVTIIFSDANNTVSGDEKKGEEQRELQEKNQHGEALNKRGPYMIVSSPAGNEDWIRGFCSKAQAIFDAGPMHEERPRDNPIFRDLAEYAVPESGDQRTVAVTVYIRCKKAHEYDHMADAAWVGACIAAKDVHAKPDVRHYEAADRHQVLEALHVCADTLERIDSEEKRKVEAVCMEMESKSFDDQLVAPYIEYIMAER